MNFRSNTYLTILTLAIALLFATACGSSDVGDVTQGETTSVTFMAGFKPQANLPFVGVYIAKENGYFDEQGLDVDIQHVNTPGENIRFLATNQVQFTTADAATVLERRTSDPALPVFSIAMIGQRGQQGFAVLEDSSIATPADWVGKTAGYKGTQPTADFFAILAANGIERSAVNDVRVGFEPQVLTEGRVDIFPVFLSNEPDTLRRLGYDVRVFEAADFGAPTLGLTYVTTDEYASENPDVVRRFLKAVLRGIAFANENPTEAIDIVLQYAPQEDREHQRFMLETELNAALGGEAEANGVGWQTLDRWTALHDYLVEYEALDSSLEDIEAAFTNDLIAAIYDDGTLIWP